MGERVFDIEAAADFMGYTKQYVRMLIKEGRLEAEKMPIAPGAKVWRYLITETAIDTFRNTVHSRSVREDNRTKWVMYGTFSEMLAAIQTLEQEGHAKVADTIRPWNKLKYVPDWVKERMDGKVDS